MDKKQSSHQMNCESQENSILNLLRTEIPPEAESRFRQLFFLFLPVPLWLDRLLQFVGQMLCWLVRPETVCPEGWVYVSMNVLFLQAGL